MVFYHVIALRSRNKTKTINNLSESKILSDYVIPYIQTGAIQTEWGGKKQTFQVADMEIYRTDERYDKKKGVSFDDFRNRRKNIFKEFEGKGKKRLEKKKQVRVFVVMPIQGEEQGTAEEQRIYAEYEARFDAINEALNEINCYGIRIDKEYPLDELVKRIKTEIEKAQFLVADLTDERPSCYFEAGYGEAKGRQIIYVASDNSVIDPKKETKIHFDIHMTVQFFRNHDQLKRKIKAVFEKNKDKLLEKSGIDALFVGPNSAV
jgi:hypothetical protein